MKTLFVITLLLLGMKTYACDADAVDQVAIAEVRKIATEMGAKKFGLGTPFIEPDRILINFVIYDTTTYGPAQEVVGTLNLSKKCVLRDGALAPIRMFE